MNIYTDCVYATGSGDEYIRCRFDGGDWVLLTADEYLAKIRESFMPWRLCAMERALAKNGPMNRSARHPAESPVIARDPTTMGTLPVDYSPRRGQPDRFVREVPVAERLVCSRQWAADRLDVLAIAVWRLAHSLRPVYGGPVCPDCQVAPDPGAGECEVCAERQEQAKRDEAMYAAGYEDARADGDAA